ncbi:MAG TPA: hypothetical protein VEB22_04670, partial [Phycisphaerales bacterium]|nr:hypothetical protein [Phycisphaerales bacterium]
MARARVDTSIQRQTAKAEGGGTFDFPLGVYPVEPLTPIEGYTVAFESADDGPPPSGAGGWRDGGGGGGGGGGGAGGDRGRGDDREEEDEPWRASIGDEPETPGRDRDGRSPGELKGFDDDDAQELDGDEGELEPWPD